MVRQMEQLNDALNGSVLTTSPEGLEAGNVGCENFSQLAMRSPESQVAATRSEFDELFSFLEPPAREMEKEYRLHLFEVKNGYKRSRYAFGEALHTYSFWCLNSKHEKAAEAQRATFATLCDLIGVERRTAYNIMDDYKRAKNVHSDFRAVAASLNIDLAERRNADLVSLLTAHGSVSRFITPRWTLPERCRCQWTYRSSSQRSKLNPLEGAAHTAPSAA